MFCKKRKAFFHVNSSLTFYTNNMKIQWQIQDSSKKHANIDCSFSMRGYSIVAGGGKKCLFQSWFSNGLFMLTKTDSNTDKYSQ